MATNTSDWQSIYNRGNLDTLGTGARSLLDQIYGQAMSNPLDVARIADMIDQGESGGNHMQTYRYDGELLRGMYHNPEDPMSGPKYNLNDPAQAAQALTGYSRNLWSGVNPDTGKQSYVIGQYDRSGNLTGIGFDDEQKSGWFKQNMDLWGPAAVLGAAALGGGLLGGGSAAGGASGGSGGASIVGGGLNPAAGGVTGLTPGAGGVTGITAGSGALMPSLGSVGTATMAGGGLAEALSSLGGSGSSILQRLVSGGLSGLTGGNSDGGGMGGLLAALMNAYSQNRQGDYQSDLAERLMNERQGFVDQLTQSYSDPGSFLNSPDFQAIQETTLNRLQRQDAASGRLANDVGRQKLLQDHAFAALENYRSGLRQAAGLGGAPLDIGRTGLSGLANELGTFNAPLSVLGRANVSGGGLGGLLGGIANAFDIGGFVRDIFNIGDL